MEPLIRFGSGRCACACLHSLLIIIKKLPSKNFLKHCLPSFPKPYPLGNNRSHDLDLRISISKSSQNRIMLSKFRSRSKHSQFAIVFTLIFRSLSLSSFFQPSPRFIISQSETRSCFALRLRFILMSMIDDTEYAGHNRSRFFFSSHIFLWV